MGDDYFLIDCGEGTQSRIIKYGLSYQKLDHILISHLHGDHYLGLFGLINTMALNGRKKPLNIYAPNGLEKLVQMHVEMANAKLPFELFFYSHPTEEDTIFSNSRVEIRTFPVSHRIPCNAFLFRETSVKRKLNIDACRVHSIPRAAFDQIKSGEDFLNVDGTTIPNELLTFDPEPAFSYGYITDTLMLENLIPKFHQVQVLYHEATFLDNLIDRAQMTFHSTAAQAARFASKSFVNQLLIGHFSSRYHDLDEHLREAQSIFAKSEIAEEGKSYQFK
jgi:ribonuclease Z